MIDPNLFDLDELRQSPLIARLDYFAESESTQTQARQIAAERELPMPALVLASQQTAGRGRGSNRWWSSPGALTFSWVIEPQQYEINTARLASCSAAIGLAVCRTLAPLLPSSAPTCGMKWPNDVFLGGRKICGVLLETLASSRGPRLVAGVGVNINNSLDGLPPEVAKLSVSLREIVGRDFELTGLLLDLLAHMDQELHRLGQNDHDQPADWNACSLLVDRQTTVETPAGLIEGRCLGLDAAGALLLASEQGVHRVLSGTVVRIEPAC
ncbi:biotin--[acetyl-CoA-carboxylase] ligase [Lignipirellula cremea]|uniref:biotin--[biotin carboxyl-carrier protein] ligase n=1 Tax=Lignipirellula cremea TaxID=2528010 RepID=A0A518E117_9BACT|nr:biotin--[acetyl-CoA-carboxylase] ligase [Lignipirellula cremea]QDU97764.1 Bifunctional ligase/repressor BirA [Lignipirellula cremea]